MPPKGEASKRRAASDKRQPFLFLAGWEHTVERAGRRRRQAAWRGFSKEGSGGHTLVSQIVQHALLVHGKEKALGGLNFQIGKIPFQKGLANLGRLIGAGFDAVEGAKIKRDVKQGAPSRTEK